MRIQLSDHFTYRRLIRFTGPSILMMIFTSVYGMVDGFFISNYVGPTPFAAVNLIMPFIMIFGAVGMVFGTGGTALVSMLQGMGQKDKADRTFSFLIYFTIAVGIISSLIGWITVPAVARALGAADSMLPYCVHYTRVCMIGNTAFILQNMFQAFLITAEKPHFGFLVTLAAGAANMILDALFMGALGYGVRGAAAATVIGQCIGGLIPLIYFMLPGQNSSLRLVAAGFDAKALVRSCTNGLSEFLSDISMSVVSMLYNIQLMKFVGESGVAAYGVIMYANFIFVGVYFGYTIGAAPVIGYHYGAGNKQELHSLLEEKSDPDCLLHGGPYRFGGNICRIADRNIRGI